MATDGLLVVDKPAGWTSHDVVARVRRLAQTRRVGHAGTLDPMATGVLVLGVERATRLLTYITGCSKSYLATIRLGQSTNTDDAQGELLSASGAAGITDDQIRSGLGAMVGYIDQVPSSVSAIKVNGVRAYARARRGEQVELAPRRVQIQRLDSASPRRLEVVGAVLADAALADASAADGGVADAGRAEAGPASASAPPPPPAAMLAVIDVDVEVDCSSGTYIRAIARDLGRALGVGGHLTALRRTAVGGFTLADSLSLEALAAQADPVAMPLAAAARRLFAVREATAEQARILANGGRLDGIGLPGAYAVFAPGGQLIAIASEADNQARAEIVVAPGWAGAEG